MVERQRVRPRRGRRAGAMLQARAIEAGLHFLRMLELQPLPATIAAAFVARFALQPPRRPIASPRSTPRPARFSRRWPAGRPTARRLEAAFRRSGADIVFIDPALEIEAGDRAEVQLTGRALARLVRARCSREPAPAAADAWLPTALEYAVSVAGRLSDDPFDECTLTATEVYEGHLDWSDFDLNREVNIGTAGDRRFTTSTQTVMPAPVSFRGAPAVAVLGARGRARRLRADAGRPDRPARSCC